jgi:hypothetical protein
LLLLVAAVFWGVEILLATQPAEKKITLHYIISNYLFFDILFIGSSLRHTDLILSRPYVCRGGGVKPAYLACLCYA